MLKFDYDFFSSEFDDDIDEEDELEIIALLKGTNHQAT